MRTLSQLLSRELQVFLNMAYCPNFSVNGIQNLHPRSLTILVAEIPVPVVMMMVILLRNVGVIVGEKMKEK